jgi:hypothetical protein
MSRQESERAQRAAQQAVNAQVDQQVSNFEDSLPSNMKPAQKQLAIQQFRAAALDEAGKRQELAEPRGGMSVADTIAISKEERAIRGEATEAKEAATEVSEGRKRDFSAAEALFSGIQNIAEVGQTAQRQAGKAGTTGIAGAIFAKLKPGSTAADMRANLDTLTADAAFGALQTMRDNSKTGGALGAISERELSLLGAAQRSLAASQSPEQLQENIRAYLKLRSESMARVKAGFAQEYGPEEANRIFGGGKSKGSTSSVKNDRNVAGPADQYLLPPSK